MSNLHATPCDQILQTLILYIDHELESEQDYQLFQLHFLECMACNELMMHEKAALDFMKNLLRSSCNEQAPQDLHQRIRQQTEALAGQSQVEYFSSTTITEFTFDGTTSIQVTQEFTQEIRHDFTEGQ
jgi:mycothiol system anti-sigma-R factor